MPVERKPVDTTPRYNPAFVALRWPDGREVRLAEFTGHEEPAQGYDRNLDVARAMLVFADHPEKPGCFLHVWRTWTGRRWVVVRIGAGAYGDGFGWKRNVDQTGAKVTEDGSCLACPAMDAVLAPVAAPGYNG